MFLVKDDPQKRREKILSFRGEDLSIGFLLAAIEFEWTLRRAILALGTSPNPLVSEELNKNKGRGLEGLKEAWKAEVKPRFGKQLDEVVKDWAGVKNPASKLRAKLVHGIGTHSRVRIEEERDRFLDATGDITRFALEQGVDVNGRLPVRRTSAA